MKGIEGFIHRILLGYSVDEAILHSMRKIQILKKIDEVIMIMIYDSLFRKTYNTKAEFPMYKVKATMPVQSSIIETYMDKPQYNAMTAMPSQYVKTKIIYKKNYEIRRE